MMKLLFIEDGEETIQSLCELFTLKIPDAEQRIIDFDLAEEALISYQPNIVILDLLLGSPAEAEPKGIDISKSIWDNHFCPILIYSAMPELHIFEHPFIKKVQKGRGSPEEALKAIQEFSQHVQMLEGAAAEIKRVFSYAMRDVSPYVFECYSDNDQRIDALKRHGRRRVGALMDVYMTNVSKLAPWEQYLFPPISDNVQLGDVLKLSDGDETNPESFRVVLSPSCDLDTSNGREPKINLVLAAKCCNVKESVGLIGHSGIKPNNLKDKLEGGILTQGYYQSLLFFPGLEKMIPPMAAKMRDLELIPFDSIGTDEDEFRRIASIDSPFRELVAWAYLNTACRPGLPDRDLDSWSQEMIDAYINESEDAEE